MATRGALANAISRASAAIDRGAVRLLERRMGAAPRRAPLPPDARRRLIELAAAYQGDGLFVAPAAAPEVTATRVDGATTDLRYESSYRPLLPGYRDEHARHRENLVAHARLWSTGPRRPAVILLHGWSQGPHWMTERMLARARWQDAGFDVVAFQLPFHGARTPAAGADDDVVGPRSGALFPSPHVARTNEAFGQAIWDLRLLARHLRGRGAPAVGVAGLSLGAYTAALWASLPASSDGADALAFAVALAPPVSMSDLMWRHGEGGPALRRAAAAGITAELLDDAFRVHAPTTRAAQLPPARLAILAGRGDRITPPAHAEALAAHWGCPITWFAGGHLAQVGRGGAMTTALTMATAAAKAAGSLELR